MIPQIEIDRLCALPMANFLASRGHRPVHRQRDEFLYLSPLRDESNASFSVNVRNQQFHDFAVADHKGSLIRLVQLLDGCRFPQAVQTLREWANLPREDYFFLSDETVPVVKARSDTIRSVKLLNNSRLVHYVESRGIPYPIARTYLQEVYYEHGGKNLFAVGLRNDRDGYALTDAYGNKRVIGSAWYSTIEGERDDAVNIFEGSFDFLSALAYYQLARPTFTTIVLNSVSFVSQAVPALSLYGRVNAYLDRDKAGWDALNALKTANLPIVDRSTLYEGHNDFNEFLKNRVVLYPKSLSL
jgi:DNA primase